MSTSTGRWRRLEGQSRSPNDELLTGDPYQVHASDPRKTALRHSQTLLDRVLSRDDVLT